MFWLFDTQEEGDDAGFAGADIDMLVAAYGAPCRAGDVSDVSGAIAHRINSFAAAFVDQHEFAYARTGARVDSSRPCVV